MTDFAPHASTDEILVARMGPIGRIRLNRPKAINALTIPMVIAVHDQLREWLDDDTVTAVLLDGEGDRGLCAGGDVRWVRDRIMAGDTDEALSFFEHEYRMNALIAEYAKPYISIMNGVVMGGGLGISAHGGVRIATESTKIAMPETAIGFFPDVGMTHLLALAPGELGTHLALTGQTVTGHAAAELGLVDVVVPADAIDDLIAQMADGQIPTPESLQELATASASPLGDMQEWIDECYAGDDPAYIVECLEGQHAEEAEEVDQVDLEEIDRPAGQEEQAPALDPEKLPQATEEQVITPAAEAAALIRQRSPLAVHLSLRAMRQAAGLSVAEVLEHDLEKARATMSNPDFLEGVRAVLVDKSFDASWQHERLEDVTDADLAPFFPQG